MCDSAAADESSDVDPHQVNPPQHVEIQDFFVFPRFDPMMQN